MGFLSVLGMARQLAGERIRPGEPVIDATLGNGVDTLFLAERTGPRGLVAGFDIQPQALERTRARLDGLGDKKPRTALFLAGHEELLSHIPREMDGRTAAVMFNLGYLPGGEDDGEPVITQPATTLAALEASLSVLRGGGVITAVLYPGHSGGREEADAVVRWAAALSPQLGQTAVYRMLQKPDAPFLVGIEKRG